MTRILILVVLLAQSGSAFAERVVTTDQGDEIPVQVYPAAGERLMIWLPSEFGTTPRRSALATALAARGVEVWSPDLHSAWFLPTGRYSLNDVDPAAVGAVLKAALAETDKTLYFMAEGRSVALSLATVRAWQTATDDTSRLGGLLAFSPNLYLRTPQGGETADYLPIATASNLPVYILQPRESAGFWHVADDVRALEHGGSPVFVHVLERVSDGFHARVDFSPAEEAMTRRLPEVLLQALELLAGYGGTPPQPAPLHGDALPPQRPDGSTLLRPVAEIRDAPDLALPSLDGDLIRLDDLRGSVVLVNFWATWCPPCVEEIPSLQRLYRRLQPHGMEILAVDVGEDAVTMRAFLKDKPVEFPVLMDTQGDALRRWGVYAFPTTLVLDRQHRIRYAVFGAFDWNSDEVVATLQPLLNDGQASDAR